MLYISIITTQPKFLGVQPGNSTIKDLHHREHQCQSFLCWALLAYLRWQHYFQELCKYLYTQDLFLQPVCSIYQQSVEYTEKKKLHMHFKVMNTKSILKTKWKEKMSFHTLLEWAGGQSSSLTPNVPTADGFFSNVFLIMLGMPFLHVPLSFGGLVSSFLLLSIMQTMKQRRKIEHLKSQSYCEYR